MLLVMYEEQIPLSLELLYDFSRCYNSGDIEELTKQIKTGSPIVLGDKGGNSQPKGYIGKHTDIIYLAACSETCDGIGAKGVDACLHHHLADTHYRHLETHKET